MSAWATGVNVGEALELCGVVKSTGPDLEKILHTLEFFGPEPGYVICGYPPFMKRVFDGMRERGFPIAEYELYAMVGGEAERRTAVLPAAGLSWLLQQLRRFGPRSGHWRSRCPNASASANT